MKTWIFNHKSQIFLVSKLLFSLTLLIMLTSLLILTDKQNKALIRQNDILYSAFRFPSYEYKISSKSIDDLDGESGWQIVAVSNGQVIYQRHKNVRE